MSTKVRSEVSQQESRIINGDLTVTGNILGKWASKIQAMLDTVLGSKWKAIDFYAPVAGEPSLGTPHWHGDSIGAGTILDQSPTVNGTFYDVTFSNAPVGTKLAFAFCGLLSTSTTDYAIGARKKGDTIALIPAIYQLRGVITANNDDGTVIMIPLDGSKAGQVAVNVAAGTGTLKVYEAMFYGI